MDSENQPYDVPVILTKNQKVLKSVEKMSLRWAKVIISGKTLIWAIWITKYDKNALFSYVFYCFL